MKSILPCLILLMSVSAHAMSVNEIKEINSDLSAVNDTKVKLAAAAVIAAGQVNSEARAAILYNVSIYSKWLKEATDNAIAGRTNSGVNQKIQTSLKAHKNETVAGVRVGEIVADAVTPYVTLKDDVVSDAQTIGTANAVLKTIKTHLKN